MSSRRFAAALGAAISVFLASPGFAQAPAPAAPPAKPETPVWSVSVGAGTFVTPEYEGSKDYKIQPYPFVEVRYRDVAFLNLREGLGVNVVNTPSLRFGPFVNYRGGRDQDANSALKGLGDVDPALDAGGFAEYRYERFRVGLNARQAVTDTKLGALVGLSASAQLVQTPGFTLSVGPSATWASGDYMETYFGVSSAQAARSGLRRYEASSGFKDYGGNLTASYALDEKWRVTSLVSVKRLIGDAADSPIVKDKGEATQFTGGVFVGYRF
jgi:MipA family protein